MGCEVHVFSRSHEKDELAKRLGSAKTVVWTEGEHLTMQNTYELVLNTLPVKLDVD